MKKSRLCYISRCYAGVSSAGSKAKTDVEDILESMGAVNVGLARRFRSGKVYAFIYNMCSVVRYLFSLRRGDCVVLQYPVKKYYAFLCRVAHWRGAKVVTLVHDLGSFRRKKLTVEQEMSRLSQGDYVIATNAVMREWLQQQGLTLPMGSLDVWDFLGGAQPRARLPYANRKRVLYAGALGHRKNSFVVEWAAMQRNYDLHIYGDYARYATSLAGEYLYCHDFMPHEAFISQVQAHYAVVWDGGSVDCCEGDFGAYLQYNTPHKISMYLRTGIPLVVWSGAAMAQFVAENGVGIVVDSLRELDALLSEIDENLWLTMCDNVAEVSSRLQEGYYLRRAVDEAMNVL